MKRPNETKEKKVIVKISNLKHFAAVFIAFSCSFDDDFCGFVQRTDDKFDWTRHRGRTSSQGTGPNRDHTTGNGKMEELLLPFIRYFLFFSYLRILNRP